MGMKKTRNTQNKKSGSGKPNWNRTIFVAFAVLFAVGMIGAYLIPVFNAPKAAAAGDVVAIEYTIYDEWGRPVLTTSQDLFNTVIESQNMVFLTQPLEMPVGTAIDKASLAAVPVYPALEGYTGFGILGFELDTLSAGLVGIPQGEMQTILFDYGGNNLEMNLSAEAFAGIVGVNFSMMDVGDRIPVGLATQPNIQLDESDQEIQVPVRMATIVYKGEDFLIVRYGYGSIDVVITRLGAA